MPARAIFGGRSTSGATASAVRRATRTTRSVVTEATASSIEQWVETCETRRRGEASSIVMSSSPMSQRWASASVWPGYL